ncbi:MAG: UDP-N-acetylmuramate--L-alanine ligase [Candidatus Firestonebacteria bacterium]
MIKKYYKVHFVGIGGIGMSGIAEVLLNLEYTISGSDVKDSEIIQRLKSKGAKINIGHKESNVSNVDVVVISSAILSSNPEVIYSKKNNIPVIPRAEILAELMRLKYGIAIAGTHGKTTTTSMFAVVFNEAGLDPTAVIGGKLNVFDSNAKLGKGDYLIAEADESDGSFLHLTPTVAIVTNIDDDHLDYYHNMENLRSVFIDFINKVPFYGFSVLCIDDANIRSILSYIDKKYITYGLQKKCDVEISSFSLRDFGSSFYVKYKNKGVGRFTLNVPGLHNISNALSVIGASLELGINVNKIKNGLRKFTGVHRRFEKIGESKGILIIDDYAHHPTEIMATLKAAKNLKREKVIAIFQPHRYTRSKLLYKKFGKVFKDIDIVIITDIYPAGEKPLPDVSAELIVNSVRKYNKKVVYIKNKEDIPSYLVDVCKKDNLVITLGAGDIRKVGENFFEKLENK